MRASPFLLSRARIAAFALATLVGAVAVAHAAADPKAAIKLRRAGFERMGAAFKTLNEQAKSDAPKTDRMAAAAQVIAATAKQQGALFPVGSGPAPGVKTDALPAIWTNRAAFDAQMAKLVDESAKLAAVTGGSDVAAIRAQVKATGAVCAACHRQFRSDN